VARNSRSASDCFLVSGRLCNVAVLCSLHCKYIVSVIALHAFMLLYNMSANKIREYLPTLYAVKVNIVLRAGLVIRPLIVFFIKIMVV